MPYLYAVSICLLYMPYLYAFCICLLYMPSLYAFSICLIYMPSLYALSICLLYMSSLYAFSICLLYMPSVYAFCINSIYSRIQLWLTLWLLTICLKSSHTNMCLCIANHYMCIYTTNNKVPLSKELTSLHKVKNNHTTMYRNLKHLFQNFYNIFKICTTRRIMYVTSLTTQWRVAR